MSATYTTRDQTRAAVRIMRAKHSEELAAKIEADQSIASLVRMRLADELRKSAEKCRERNRQEWDSLSSTDEILTHVRNRY